MKLAAFLGVWLILVFGGLFLHHAGYGFTYQSSDSMPKGWYVYKPTPFLLHRGEVVVFHLPRPWEHYLLTRHFILPHTWLLKKVAAVPGDLVCIRDQAIYINQQRFGAVLQDSKALGPLPKLNFCRPLKPGEYMLMSGQIERSFDSRYFGPILRPEIVGEAFQPGEQGPLGSAHRSA